MNDHYLHRSQPFVWYENDSLINFQALALSLCMCKRGGGDTVMLDRVI